MINLFNALSKIKFGIDYFRCIYRTYGLPDEYITHVHIQRYLWLIIISRM